MGTRVELRSDLEQVVMARFVRPQVQRVRDTAAGHVRRFAPPGKVWVSARDERVRHTHVDVDSQTVPDNLRYRLERADAAGTVELGRAPRDEALSIENRAGCRCVSVPLPDAVARTVLASPVVVEGSRAYASVSVTFPRVVESEYPGEGDSGGGWMRRALRETAERSRGS